MLWAMISKWLERQGMLEPDEVYKAHHLDDDEVKTTSHSHRCPRCKTKWWHKRCEVKDCAKEHTCPNCGETDVMAVHSWKREPGT